MFGGDMRKLNRPSDNMLVNKMTIDFNTFGAFHEIPCPSNLNCTEVGPFRKTPSSEKRR